MLPAKLSPPSEGLHQKVDTHENRAVKIQRGGHPKSISIARIAPSFGKEQQEQIKAFIVG